MDVDAISSGPGAGLEDTVEYDPPSPDSWAGEQGAFPP